MGTASGVAVVTGAGQGLGAAIARRLASDGYEVAVLDVDDERAALLAEEIKGRAVHCDVSDPDAVRAAAAEVGPADVLVNNAGICSPSPRSAPPTSTCRRWWRSTCWASSTAAGPSLPP